MRLVLLALLAALPAAAPGAPGDRVAIPAMKTSIYVGSVTLATSEFVRDGETYRATYEARVRPWFFWSESGRITIELSREALGRLRGGETVEFTGDAFNHREKPRRVTGRAQPAGVPGDHGKIKVRIGVDDIELIFNGTYEFPPDAEPAATPGTAQR